jgi:hypothetical protein
MSTTRLQRDDQAGVEDDGAEHEGVVAVEGGVHELAAEAGDLKDGLDDEGAGEDAGDGRPEEGDDREQAAAQGVPEHNAGSEAPLARAVRMKSWFSTSSMPPRVRREVGGVDDAEGEGGQHAVDPGPYQPEALNQPRWMAKASTSSGPSTKVGTQMPIMPVELTR